MRDPASRLRSHIRICRSQNEPPSQPNAAAPVRGDPRMLFQHEWLKRRIRLVGDVPPRTRALSLGPERTAQLWKRCSPEEGSKRSRRCRSLRSRRLSPCGRPSGGDRARQRRAWTIARTPRDAKRILRRKSAAPAGGRNRADPEKLGADPIERAGLHPVGATLEYDRAEVGQCWSPEHEWVTAEGKRRGDSSGATRALKCAPSVW
jgi:hypothetical protein